MGVANSCALWIFDATATAVSSSITCAHSTGIEDKLLLSESYVLRATTAMGSRMAKPGWMLWFPQPESVKMALRMWRTPRSTFAQQSESQVGDLEEFRQDVIMFDISIERILVRTMHAYIILCGDLVQSFL